jgi:two-component system, chemotaxis family, chemotaxis protein CheY
MTGTKSIKVLLADDEKHVRQLVKAILLPLNCEVAGEAENGEQAVSLYKEIRPDLVLLDVNMPVKDGKEALHEIMELNKGAVVIMLTSMSDIATVQASIDLGAVYYIRKDTPPAEMREMLKSVFQQYLAD